MFPYKKLKITIYNIVVKLYPEYPRKVYKMKIGEGSIVSHKARLDKTINPKGIHIGDNTFITGRVVVLTHDACRGLKADTCIGDNCFIGLNSIILPGISIGNEVVVGAGSVVTKNVPSNCIVAGNPAKIIRTGIRCGKFGKIIRDE